MSKRGGPNPVLRADDGRRDNPGRPSSPYIERRGEIAVKVSCKTRAAIELIALRRGIGPGELVEELVKAARQLELDEDI